MKKVARVFLLLSVLFVSDRMGPLAGQENKTSNSPPVISGIPDITINQNSKAERVLDLWKYAKDPDTPLDRILFNLVLPRKSMWEGSARAKLEMNRYVNLAPDINWTGVEEIIAEVNDGTSLDWTTFEVIVLSAEAGEQVEAEDQAKVERKGNWVEFSEGKMRWLQSKRPGDALSFKFKGSFLTISLWGQELNLLQRYYEGPKHEVFEAWKTYSPGVVNIKVDGRDTKQIDLSHNDRKGWNEYLVASGLEPSEHELEIIVRKGFVNVDKIRASPHPLSELSISVTDEYETPLSDIVLKFIQENQPKVILRTGPEGKIPAFYGLKEGIYDVLAEPASNPGYVQPPPRVEENIEPQKLDKVEIMAGQASRLNFSLKYSGPDYRSLHIIRRPIGTIPSIVKKGEILNIECQYLRQPQKIQAFLFDDYQTQSLEIVSAEHGPQKIMNGLREGLLIRAKIPLDIPQALYGLKILLDEKNDVSQRAVKVVSDFKKEYRIAHLSDLHIQSPKDNRDHDWKLLDIARAISLLSPEFVIMTGDIADSGSRPEYLRFIKALQSFDVPTYVIPGNHDHYFFTGWNYFSYGFDEYEKYLGQKFFSFPYGSDYFIGVDTGDYERIYETPLEGIHAGQWPWLLRELETAAGRPKGLLCLFAHYDYTQDLPESYSYSRQLVNLFNIYPINLFTYGHGHTNLESQMGKNSTLTLETASPFNGQFRLIDIKEGKVAGYPVLDAGKLRVNFSGKNDGTEYVGQAFLKNDMDKSLSDIRMRFGLRNSDRGYRADKGKVVETIVSADRKRATVVVSIDLLPRSEVSVKVLEAQEGSKK